jgi:hypothetical protein
MTRIAFHWILEDVGVSVGYISEVHCWRSGANSDVFETAANQSENMQILHFNW